MTNFAQTSRQFLLKSLLIIAMICLLLIVMVQMALLIGINALNIGKLHRYIQSEVTTTLATGGYNATFDKLTYDPVRGFTLSDLKVSDQNGEFLTSEKISLDIAFLKIPLRHLDMIIDAGQINMERLPVSAEHSDEPLKPFSTPDIYLTKITLSPLKIDRLAIGEQITGQQIILSPTLKADIKLRDTISVEASLLPKADALIGGVSLPENIEFDGDFTPQPLAFSLNNLLIASKDYKLKGVGEGQLTEEGKISVKIDADYPDLTLLTQNNFQSAKATLNIAGTSHLPIIDLDGKIIPQALKEKGLEDIIVSAHTDEVSEVLKGNVAIQTHYLEKPITLDSVLTYQNNLLSFDDIKGTAPFISLNGAGVISSEDSLFNGKLSVKASDLSYYKDLLSVDIGGAFDVEAILKPMGTQQSADINVEGEKLKYDGMGVGKGSIDLHFADVNYLWPQTADVQLTNLSLTDTMSFDKLEAHILNEGNETYQLSLAGNGNIPSPISFKGDTILSDITTDFPTFNDIHFITNLGKSAITLNGSMDKNAVALKLSTKNFNGANIPAALPDALANIRLTGDVTMAGSPAAPETTAHIVANGITTGKYKDLIVNVDAEHHHNIASVSLVGKGRGIKALKVKSTFPVVFSLYPFVFDVDMDAAINGTMGADLDVGAISPLFLPPTQALIAALKANATMSGTLSSPRIDGALKIQNGQFTDDQNGIVLRAMNINSTFTKSSLLLQSLTATDGAKGRMTGQGRLNFAGGEDTNLSLSMKDFHLPSSNLADGTLDARLSLKDQDNGYLLGGAVDIREMNIIVPETFQSKIPQLNIVERKGKSTVAVPQIISLGIKVNAPNQVFVRGWGLDAEFGGALDIAGDITAPLIDGTLTSKRGRYEEFGKRFTLERGNLRFQGQMPPSPYLDIEATTPANDVKASVLLAGPVTKPAITFSSVPALPQDEVLSRLLFGKETTKITPFQAIQLAQSLRRFSGEGSSGLNPLEMLRSATGLDDISVDTDASGETNVGVGKYLTDKVYLEFEKGKAPGSGAANVQIELTHNINVQSEVGQDAQAGGGIFWKKDY